jgi:hypothetical protein
MKHLKKYESIEDEPKFSEGDKVYIKSQLEDAKKTGIIYNNYEIIKVLKKVSNFESTEQYLINRYVLDEYPNLSFRENSLISDIEVNANKFNL